MKSAWFEYYHLTDNDKKEWYICKTRKTQCFFFSVFQKYYKQLLEESLLLLLFHKLKKSSTSQGLRILYENILN